MIKLSELLEYGRIQDYSDLHITVGCSPYGRLRGALVVMPFSSLENADIFGLIEEMIDKETIDVYAKGKDIDTSFADSLNRRYRVNLYRQQNQPCIAIRLLREEIPSMAELSLPDVVETLSNLPRGLVLVTGPTGSGKSTTMAAMIDYINTNRKSHIVTIEDPIEYVHAHKNSLIHQREVGSDVSSFHEALRSVLREDPDVILVGEMRDLETISAAITAAETGHLVISSLHTNTAVSTIDRIIDVFPPHQQQQVRVQLASVLKGIVTQQLLPKSDESGRIAAFEVLMMTDSVASMIRENKTHQIVSTMQTSASQGMQLMDKDLAELVKKGIIFIDVASQRCNKIETLMQYLR